MFLWNNTGFISYARWDGEHTLIVAINNNNKPITVDLPVWKAGVGGGYITSILATHDHYLNRLPLRHPVTDGFAKLAVPAHGAVILEAER